MNQLALMEALIHNNLAGAEVIACVLSERCKLDDSPPDYWENIWIVAWERREGPRTPMCGTHRFNINSHGDTMLVVGHYDFTTPEEALKDMLERAKVTA